MALDAGSVYVNLGGKLETGDFARFGALTHKAKADMEAAEKGIVASQARVGEAVKRNTDIYRNAGRQQTMAMKAIDSAAKGTAIATGALAVGGIALVGKVAFDAVKKAAGFEAELRRLGARSDVTDKQLRRVRKASLDLGTGMGVGATMAAKASTELIKGGLSVTKLLNGGLKGALALAVAGEMDVAKAAETMADAMNLFKIPGSQATHVADALATAANATTADVADMAIALTQGGSAAKAAGLSFDETVAALESLALAGVKGSDAGTSLKSALTQVANPTKEAAELMGDLGLKFFDAQGNMKPLTQVSGMLRDKMKGLTNEQRLQAATTLAGTDGMRALLALYDAGPKTIEKLQKGLKEQGTAAKVAAEQNEGAAGAARKLGAAWEQAQILFGEQVLPAVADGAEVLADKLNEMAQDGSLKRLGQDFADFASAIVDGLPAAVDELERFAESTGDKVEGAAAWVETAGQIVDAMKLVSTFTSGAWVGNPFDFLLGGAKAALVAMKLVAQAFDSITPGDQSGPVDYLNGLIEKVDATRRDLANKDIKISFEADAASLDQIYQQAERLTDMGKRGVAIKITAEAGSAEAAIEGMKLVIDGVPEQRVLNIIARSQNAQEQVEAFKALAAGVPNSRVMTIQTKAKTAQAAILAFQAIAAGVPPSKVTKVLAETNSARGQINGIIGLINSVPASRSSTITINRVENLIRNVKNNVQGNLITPRKKRAAGRPAGGTEKALIGEGRGPEWWVDGSTGAAVKTAGPQFADLGPSDYVIPTEGAYRGRALGLLGMLAADLGVPGFKKGKDPKKKKARYVPPKLNPQAYSVDQFETRETGAENAVKKGQQLQKNLRTARASLRDIERRNPKTAAQKENKTDDARRQRAKIRDIEKDLKALPENGNEGRLRAILKQRRAELSKAKRFQADIRKQEELADIARDQMQLADNRDDQGAYDRAQGSRAGALGKLKQLLGAALGFAQAAGNDDFVRALQAQIGQTDLALDDTAAVMDTGESEAERVADTGMTDAERRRLGDLDKDVALAALTATLGDDQAAAGARVGFLEGILADALVNPARGGAATITQLAGMVKSARDDVTSLRDTPDLQAQIEQANERARVATESEQISSQALKAFQGWSAGPGAGTTINISTLHPGDSQTLVAIAQAANAGNDVNLSRPASTIRMGP